MKLEVIMAAYNNPEALTLVLAAYSRQTDMDFNVSVADDGSTDNIRQICEQFRSHGLNVSHFWHEDNGFRRSQIINRALAASTADYIVLTDSDCIPSRYFVADHKSTAEKQRLIVGRRVDLKSEITSKIYSGSLPSTKLDSSIFLVMAGLKKKLSRAEFGIRWPDFISHIMNRKKRKALGANMAAWREDLLAVNGFDNDFVGYGMEETDLEWRLNKIGITNKSVVGRAALMHLYHPVRTGSADCVLQLERKKSQGIVKVRNGIVNLSSEV